ncbi:MAG TPA: DoxX family protein [Burkholderiales bacterium]|nr:DoxX family protein [Burkholderiales bacterium]
MSPPVTVASADAGKLLLRLTVGILLLLHGLAKVASGPDMIVGLVEKVGLPGSFGYAVYLGEVVAPLALILGVWTRIAALVVVANMAVAIALVHMGELFSRNQGGGWALELQGFFLLTALAVALIGPGRYALTRS